MAELFDSQLIDACKKGDRASQRILFDRLAPRMFPLCIRYVKDRSLAEDILQDGFITLFTRIDTYKADGSFEEDFRNYGTYVPEKERRAEDER